jgi:hypothetical protein
VKISLTLEAQRKLKALRGGNFAGESLFLAGFSSSRLPQVFLKNFSSRISILYPFTSSFYAAPRIER